MIHDVPTDVFGVEKYCCLCTDTISGIHDLHVTRFSGREDQKGMCRTIKIPPIKGEDVPRSIPFQRFLIRTVTFLFVVFPVIIGFRPCCKPIVKDLRLRVFRS